MNEIVPLENLLDQTPTDWGLRLIYADALEEVGCEKEAKFQRWLVKTETSPLFSANLHEDYRESWHYLYGNWCLFSNHKFPISKYEQDFPSYIGSLILSIPNGPTFHNRKEAESYLYEVWFNAKILDRDDEKLSIEAHEAISQKYITARADAGLRVRERV